MRARMRALPATLLSIVVWLIVAFGLLVVRGRADMNADPLFRPSSLREGRWYEYADPLRARRDGDRVHRLHQQPLWRVRRRPFPRPASDLLRQRDADRKHEIRRKREAGLAGERRGQEAAALDAAGAALGAIGMLAFAWCSGCSSSTVSPAPSPPLHWPGSSSRWRHGSSDESCGPRSRPQREKRPRDVAKPLKFTEGSMLRRVGGFGVDALAQRYRVELRVRCLLLV